MSALRRAVLRLFSALRPGRREDDLAREVSAHLTVIEDDLISFLAMCRRRTGATSPLGCQLNTPSPFDVRSTDERSNDGASA
jgi:hypothetical protein